MKEIENRKENIYLLSCRGGVPSLSAGINNPMTALFEKDNVYSDYDAEVLLFLKSNYGENIEMEIVEEINGYQIVKYYRSE